MGMQYAIEDDYDFEDIDCESCGMKFFIRPSLYTAEATARRVTDGCSQKLIDKYLSLPTQCERCQKGLPPLYEY